MLGEVLRNKVYWLLDFTKGNPVKKHLSDIEMCMQVYDKESQLCKLEQIVAYAKKDVAFYRNSGIESFLDCPVVNKSIIRSQYDQFQSDEFREQNVHILRTSGSTGNPFEIRQDNNKRNRCLAEMMYFWGLSGYKIGQKYVYYRTWNSENRKSKISAFARNIEMRDIVRFDDYSLQMEYQYLKSNRNIKMLLGYASTLENLGFYLSKIGAGSNEFGVECVIAISESLSETGRKNLQTVFGCPVVSHYSNSENGVIAQWNENTNGFLVNTASLYIELLDMESDTPVQDGTPGRVVVTDLYNHAMPFLRYDTGDIAICETTEKGVIIKYIEGRKIDFISDTKGNKVSPHEISVLFWKYPEVAQYQFIQETEKSYRLKLIVERFEKEDSLKADIMLLLGRNIQLEIEYTDKIELAASGKRKYIVNRTT